MDALVPGMFTIGYAVSEMNGQRLLLYDRTSRGVLRGLPGLTTSWRVGALLYRKLGRIDHAFGASTWDEGLAWLGSVAAGEPIQEIQYWGHGNWGNVLIDRKPLDVDALEPEHPLHPRLVAIRDRLVPGGGALWWFRTCETFGTERGHEFARRWADFFGSRVAGHTYVIALSQSGLHTLRPGEKPSWSVTEGLPSGTGPLPEKALWSRWSAPNTIGFLTGRIPEEF